MHKSEYIGKMVKILFLVCVKFVDGNGDQRLGQYHLANKTKQIKSLGNKDLLKVGGHEILIYLKLLH